MKTAILFIIVLANSFLLRTVIADSFTKNYIEEETALLTCSSEFNEIMKIATIKYEIGNCSYNELYGIGNLCNGRTKCTFKVNNSNIGSSCGANGTASLGVTYNCIRNGGWTQWKNATTSCPVNCGGALQNVTRTCTNPTPNEFGAPCSGTSFDEQICNDNACPYQNIGMYVRHNLTKYERIAVVRNDNVGWYDGGNNIIGYYDCSPNNETCLTYSLLKPPVNDGDEIYTDGIPSISDKIFAWNFSTTERNVYVKNVLPHTVRKKYYSHNFTLTVQDSCYNEATSSVTIITYNVPPLISGIQNCLIIDPDVAQRAPYLTVFNVKDASGDNVSCMIKKSNLKTEMFYLQLINLDVYLKLVNGVSIWRDSTSQYILTIICDDGTENTELDLRIQFRPQNEDAIVQMYTEGGRAYLTCSGECNETIDITSIKYTKGPCSHSETYGIRNICNGKTNCSFGVSNSNIGSSCGANGTAMFKVEYYCIRNGGWSGWTTPASCPVKCGAGFHNVSRTCSNPYQNERGSTCIGDSFDVQTCNTHDCVVQNTACLNEKVDWNCPNGHIEVIKAEWETSKSCGSSFSKFVSYNVINRTKMNCDNRQTCSFIANDHYLGISCSTSASRCTTFKFVYVCIKATWEGWSSWSECTRSCGSGIQTRHRQCLNQMNTKDGYKADCNGNGSNSRSCHTEPCPYCSDKNFLNALPKSLSDLKEDTSPGMLHLNGIFAVNCCGRIKTWMFIPVKTGSLTFVILRKTNGYKYKCVGSNAVYISALDLHTTTQFDVADSERIVIIQGDIIGWYGNNIGYCDCIARTKACPLSLRLNDPVNVGDVIDIHRLSNLSNRIYAFNYSTTENRPVTINISSEPVTIPDHLNVDSFVMTISILDPDYGDYIQDFKLDYQNEYFYLDTQRRSVHVKKALPHLVGHSNATLNFTCIVQDSCFNLANITITIISFNVPPAVTDLPDVLILDPQQLSDNSSFHIFRVEDPSNDNVSCGLSKISPSTDRLTLEMDLNEAFLRVFNHSTSNTTLEYELEIYCDDGTDETIIKLIVHFRSKKNSESAEFKIIYVAGSIGGLLLVVIIIVVLYYCFSKRQKTLITSKSSNESNINSLYTSIIYDNAAVNPYDNIEQIGNKQIPTDHFEMSKPDTNLYENTKIFI
ncbi:Hypothetical predicted protein [Mytilus galloprovincialis]|uniref:Hemicentin-1 n=1 Tax=Mytilus galloprovincialis TaxID=29158 RepID=A0A8B6HAR3_MYTGA|nr:Hypothetical predicted protein [Mytilus galloprovincialis]